jgi:hypothetical protein
VVLDASGEGPDLPLTQEFLTLARNEAFRPQRSFKGRRVVSLAMAFGYTEIPIVDPVSLTGIIGENDAEVDYATRSPLRVAAFIWAHATGHPAWQNDSDYSIADVIDLDVLPKRWQNMVRDYERAVEEEHLVWSILATEATMALIAYWQGRTPRAQDDHDGMTHVDGVGWISLVGAQGVQINPPGSSGNTQNNFFGALRQTAVAGRNVNVAGRDQTIVNTGDDEDAERVARVFREMSRPGWPFNH